MTGALARLLPVLVLLGGCTNALIYGERTSFNLAISVNDDAAVPVSINAGLQRNVITFAPPVAERSMNGQTSAAGESVAAVSRFDLAYTPGAAGPLAGTLVIRTQFLSGEAAILATSNPATAARTVQLVTTGRFIASSPTVDRLNAFLGNPPDPKRQASFATCQDKVPGLQHFAIPIVLSDKVSEDQRKQILSCLKLDTP